MSTVAGLPKYVSLKSMSNGKYLHCISEGKALWVGCMRDLAPDDPLVRLEVVPSASDPIRLIHLRCSYNNKFLQPDQGVNTLWINARADAPDEDRTRNTSTLFQPVFLAGHERNTVGLVHVQTNYHLQMADNINARFNGYAFLYNHEGMYKFEFAAWGSNLKEITSVTDGEIQQLKSSYEEKMKAKDTEIQQLKSCYEEKMKAKDKEIQKLKKSTVGEDSDGIVGELRMEIAELKVQLDDAWKEIEDLKVVVAAN